MNLEDDLRQSLRRRAGAVVPAEPEWSHVGGRLAGARRGRRTARLAGAVGGVVAVVAALLVVIARASDAPHPIRTAGGPNAVPSKFPVAPTTSTPEVATKPAGGRVPAGFRPVSVTWISTSDGWVLGTAPCGAPPCTSLVRTTDGGATWVGVPAPRTELTPVGGSAGVSRVRFADEHNGWIYGPDLWATHDGGSSWRRVDVPPVAQLEAGGGMAYAVMTTGKAHAYAASVDGDAWRSLGADDIRPYAELVLHGTGGYVMGEDGVVRALSAGGLERRGTPCPQAAPSISLAGDDLVAVCVTGAALGSSSKLFVVSSDGGRTWRTTGAPPSPGSPTGIAGASPSTIVVAAASGASFLYRTDDGGATWSTALTEGDGGAGFADLGFTNATRGVVIAAPSTEKSRLLLTTDAGRTWSTVTFSR